jgi:biotin synthase
MADWPKSPITRWRRIQLVKHLIEEHGLQGSAIGYDEEGFINKLSISDGTVSDALNSLDSGTPFMTNGCPIEGGKEVGCSRPYGSYTPAESFRDFPFQPTNDDLVLIRKELELEKIIEKN